MYTLFASVLAFAVIAAITCFVDQRCFKRQKRTSLACAATIGAVIGAVVGVFAAGGPLREKIPLQEVAIASIQLASMRSVDAPSGTFIWGTGSFGNTTKYQFYIRQADGSVTPSQLPADELIRITEDPALKNEGSWTVYQRQRDPESSLNKWAIFQSEDERITRHVLRVPVGTVLVKFQVN